MNDRKFEKDIEDCVKRLFTFETASEKWSRSGGGNMEIFGFLNLEGNTSIDLPPHPILSLNEDEKKAWIQCFGEPIKVPKNLLTSVSMHDFLTELKAKRDLYREVIAFTQQSRFRNKNYRNQEKAPKAANASMRNKFSQTYKKKPYKKKHKGKPYRRG